MCSLSLASTRLEAELLLHRFFPRECYNNHRGCRILLVIPFAVVTLFCQVLICRCFSESGCVSLTPSLQRLGRQSELPSVGSYWLNDFVLEQPSVLASTRQWFVLISALLQGSLAFAHPSPVH